MKYDFTAIEAKWQKEWEEKKLFKAETGGDKEKFYGLIEFPFPSGVGLHVGHARPYTAMDVIARKKRMEGYNVLFPMGYDAFGLPTENYAIKNHIHPRTVTEKNVATFRSQLKALGYSFDWDREINTTDPKYFKWTQWIFLQMFKRGLAYKAKMPVPTRPRCRSTGAPPASACWPTKRWSRACASAAALPSSARSAASGCWASPSMPTA